MSFYWSNGSKAALYIAADNYGICIKLIFNKLSQFFLWA